MEILLPGNRNDSSGSRLKMTRRHFDHVPNWRCTPAGGRPFFVCGKCFSKRGAGPFTNTFEMWMPGTDTAGNFHHEIVPVDAVCSDCGGHAWPAD